MIPVLRALKTIFETTIATWYVSVRRSDVAKFIWLICRFRACFDSSEGMESSDVRDASERRFWDDREQTHARNLAAMIRKFSEGNLALVQGHSSAVRGLHQWDKYCLSIAPRYPGRAKHLLLRNLKWRKKHGNAVSYVGQGPLYPSCEHPIDDQNSRSVGMFTSPFCWMVG